MRPFVEGLADYDRGNSYRSVKSKQVSVHSLENRDTQMQCGGEMDCVRGFETRRVPILSDESPGGGSHAHVKSC